MESFLKIAALEGVKRNNLLKLTGIIDWEQQRLILKKIDRSGLGPTGYDTLRTRLHGFYKRRMRIII
jgi:hypothetical protein